MTSRIDFWELRRRNARKTVFLILLYLVVIGVFGWLIDFYLLQLSFPWATVISLTYGALQVILTMGIGGPMVARSLGARPANPSDPLEKRFINVVEEMAIAAGIPTPKAYVLDEDAPNAFAAGWKPEKSVVCATRGLLEMMNREELMGVVGHEVAHIRNGDTRIMTTVAGLATALVLLGTIAYYVMRFMGYAAAARDSKRDRRGGGGGMVILVAYLIGLLIFFLSRLLARLLAMAVSRSREYMADAGSVEFTRNPLGLASALEKIASWKGGFHRKHVDAYAHLFISEPKPSKLSEGESWFSNLFSTHPPIKKRIELLKKMAGAA